MPCSSCGGNKSQKTSSSAARKVFSAPKGRKAGGISGYAGFGSPKVKISFGNRGR